MENKTISLHDHRLIFMKNNEDLDKAKCSCGKVFDDPREFIKHRKEVQQEELKELGIEVV